MVYIMPMFVPFSQGFQSENLAQNLDILHHFWVSRKSGNPVISSPVKYCGIPGPPCLSILLRSLADKLYFLLSIGLSRRLGHFRAKGRLGAFDGDPASLARDNILRFFKHLKVDKHHQAGMC